MEHVVIYREEDAFCAWPFNGGLWSFDDGTLAVGFIRGRCDYSRPDTLAHRIVDNLYGEQLIIRSTDGGMTWPRESVSVVYRRPEFDRNAISAPVADVAHNDPVDPTVDGFCLLSGFGIPPESDPTTHFVMTSVDRGHTWSAPVRVPNHGFIKLGGRPSYVLRHDGMLLLFGHAHRDGTSAVPVVYGSTDGGASWGLVAEVEPVPALPRAIMPYPVVLGSGRILIAVRREYGMQDAYTQVYESIDDGRSWALLSRVNDWGAPASLTELPDGRVVCVYGYRRPPWGIRARVSADGGVTWGEEIILRDDGGSRDLGYPRTHLRNDGRLVTVYYFNTRDDSTQMNGGVRHIAATIWSPA